MEGWKWSFSRRFHSPWFRGMEREDSHIFFRLPLRSLPFSPFWKVGGQWLKGGSNSTLGIPHDPRIIIIDGENRFFGLQLFFQGRPFILDEEVLGRLDLLGGNIADPILLRRKLEIGRKKQGKDQCGSDGNRPFLERRGLDPLHPGMLLAAIGGFKKREMPEPFLIKGFIETKLSARNEL